MTSHRPPCGTYRAQRFAVKVVAGVALLASVAHADIETSVDENGVVSLSSTRKVGRSSEPKLDVTMPSDKSKGRLSRYDAFIREASRLYQIPESLVRAVIKVESDFDPRAVSPANAQGLMQLIPETAERMMVTDVFEPRQNILGGTRYLRILANMFNGDLQLTVAAYNAGEGAVMRYGGIPPYAETQAYVTKVVGYYQEFRAFPASEELAPSQP